MASYVIDTDVASDILFGEETAATLVDFIQQEPECRVFISEITRLELLSMVNLTQTMSRQINDLIEVFDEVIVLDEVVSRKAAELRRLGNGPMTLCPQCGRRIGGKLKTPDSIVAATAASEQAILITRNLKDYQHLVECAGLQVQIPSVALEELRGRPRNVASASDQQE